MSAMACPRCGARLTRRAEGSVHACPSEYVVSAWPPDHECPEAHLWSLLVAYRGGGQWAVELGEGHGDKPVLTRSGQWAIDRRGDPACRFALAEALDAARAHAPAIEVAGRTAAEALAAHQARGCPAGNATARGNPRS